MLFRCLATTLCLLWLSACGGVPLLPPEHQSKLHNSDFLKVHATKKAEVIQRLGAPAFDAGRFLVYDDYSDRWREVGFILFVPIAVEPYPGPAHHYHLVCAFDESGVLADYDATRDTDILRRGDGVLKPGRAPDQIDTKHFPSGDWNVALSPNGEFAALSANYVSDIETAGNIRQLMNLKLATTLATSERGNVEFSHDGRTAAVFGVVRRGSSTLRGPDGVLVLDTGTGAIRVNFKGHGSNSSSSDASPIVRSVAFSQDGRLVASGASDGTVMIWDAESGRKLSTLKASDSGVMALAFSPDDKTLATTAVSDDGTQETVKVWDVGSGRQVAESDDASLAQLDELKMPWENGQARLAFSPDGALLAINRGWIVEVLGIPSAVGGAEKTEPAPNTGSGIPLAKVRNVFLSRYDTMPLSHLVPRPSRLAVAFSPDKGRLVASTDRVAVMWDLASSRELWRVDGSIVDVALSADGTRLYMASYSDISVYDIGS